MDNGFMFADIYRNLTENNNIINIFNFTKLYKNNNL